MIFRKTFVALVVTFLVAHTVQAGSYFQNLKEDIADVFQLNVGFGWGLAANVKATDFATAYAGYARTERAGLGRREWERWSEEEGGFPLINGFRTTEGASDETDLRLSSAVYTILDCENDEVRMRRIANGAERLNIEAGVTAICVSARVGFSLGQFADLLCTAVGFDLARDNDYQAPPPPKKKEKASPPAKKKTSKKKSSSKKKSKKSDAKSDKAKKAPSKKKATKSDAKSDKDTKSSSKNKATEADAESDEDK